MVEKKVRVLMAKVSLDGHDRGIKMVARGLTDAGMEVVYLGSYQTVDRVVNAAIQENVDVIGLSFLSGEHMMYVPKIIHKMKERNLHDVRIIIGGVIPKEDIPKLKEMGVSEVFRSGSTIESIANYILNNTRI
ncbi:MAG: cobalamin B12-binding domain-containing protein [Pseudomonadota bacterium]